jgi:hypothetical protein
MCANLLTAVESGYSYGISGYDKWGCDISTTLEVPVHQYDCFNPTEPSWPAGRTVFHHECVGEAAATIEGRPFDTIENQFRKSGDHAKRIVLKIDVEGAEWYARVIKRLKQFFEIAHIHFNNASCLDGLDPFPSWAYEVVNKALAAIDPSGTAGGIHPLDAPNNPLSEDCQPK